MLPAANLPPAPLCRTISPGQDLNVTIHPKRPACVRFTTTAEGPVQLVVSQPIDVELRPKDSDDALIDAFEFGPETFTPAGTGGHEILIARGPTSDASVAQLRVSIRAIAPSLAESWRQAERSTTVGKRSASADTLAAPLPLWQKLGQPLSVARILLMVGDTHRLAARFREARETYERALKICRAAGDRRCSGEAASNSGLVSQTLGDFELAEARSTSAIEDFHAIGSFDLEALARNNLGILYGLIGDYRRAIRESSAVPASATYARMLADHNIGLCYQSLAEYDRAQAFFERSRASAGRRHDTGSVKRTNVNLGRNFLLAGHPQRALALLDDVLATVAPNDRGLAADIQGLRGQALLALRRSSDAEPLLRSALETHRAIGDQRMQAVDLHHLGLALSARGDISTARQYFEEALAIRQSHGLRDTMTDTLYELAHLERRANNTHRAQALAERAVDTLESIRRGVPGPDLRASLYARKRKLFDLMVDLVAEEESPGSAATSLLAAERVRGRAMLDLLTEGGLSRDVPFELRQKHEELQRRIDLLSVRIVTARPATAAALQNQVELLLGEDQAVRAKMREAAGGERFGSPVQSVEQIRRHLPAGSALLEYYLASEHSYAWVVDQHGLRMFTLPGRDEVERQVSRVTSVLDDILERRRSPEAQRRFDGAVARVSATLLGFLDGVRLPSRVLLVPDGSLSALPFAALKLPRGPRLGLAHELVQVSSASYLVAGRQPGPAAHFPKSVLALVDPVFSGADPRVKGGAPANVGMNLARLPYDLELETIRATAGSHRLRVLRGFDASLAGLERAHPGQYAVIHMSTHAEINDRVPELSGIILSLVSPAGRPRTGILRPDQFSHLALNGSAVVLSACNTATGKQISGEGMAGFTESLFRAGASQLVLTVSQVDAEASSEFFRQVYAGYFGRGETLESALRSARKAMARSSRWADPYFWAPFTLIGRPAAHLPDGVAQR